MWASQSRINPAFDIGTHIPTWLGVFQFSGQVGAQNLDDVITTGLVREYNIAATATGTNTGTQNEFAGSIFEVGNEDLHVHRAGGRVNNASSRSGYRVVLFSAQEISSTNHQIQDNTHADYFYHRSSSRSVSSGQQYVEAGFDQIIPANSFFGVAVTHSSGVRPTFGDDSEIDTIPGSASFSWVSAALSEDSSESDLDGQNLQPSLVGAYTTRVEFSTSSAIKFSSSFTYTAEDGIYEIDVDSTTTGGVTSFVAGEGLVGNSTTGDVVVDIDETATDFPVIPIDKGGTGADTASEAITNLGADQAFIGASWIGLDRELVFNRLGGGTPDTVPITISGFRGVSGDSFISSVTFHFGDYCVIGNLLYVYTERVTTNFTSTQVEASSDFVSLPILDSNGDVFEDQIPPEIARLISPALTGTPTAPTPSAGDNDTSIATTAFVQGELQDLVRDVIESGGVVTVTKEDGTTSTFNLTAGGGGGLTQDQVDARVQVGVYDWAEEGNIDELPTSKLPDATSSDEGAVRGVTTSEVDDESPGGTIFGWSINHFRRLVHRLVPDWAQTGNSDDVPVSKIPSEIARLDAPVFTGDSQSVTPTAGDSDTSIATTAFVQGELQDLVRDVIESSGTVTVTKEDGTTNTFSLRTDGGDSVAVETLFDNTSTTETAFTTGTGNGWNSAVDVILSRVLVTDDDALDLRGRFEYTRFTSRRSIDFTMNAGVFRNFGDTSALTGTTQATEGYHMFLLQDARASGNTVGNTFTRLGIVTRGRTSGGEEVLRLLMNLTGNDVGAVTDMRGVVELVPVGGAQGVQGQYTVTIYRNATTPPAQPTGGSVDVSTGVVTPPADWTTSPATPSSGENTYASSATVNPNSQSGSITPTWSAVFTAGGTGPPGPQGEQGEQGLQGDDGAVGTAVTANPSGTDGDDLERVDIGGTNYNISGLGTRYYLTNPSLSTSGLYSVSIPGILDTRTGDIIDMPIAGTTLVTDQTTGVRLQVNSAVTTNVTHADGSSVTFEDLRVITNLRWQLRRTGAVHIVEGFDLFEFVGRTATTVADDDSFVFGDVSEAGEPPVRIESVDLFDQIRPSAQSDGTDVLTSPLAYDFRGTGVTVTDESGVARVTVDGGMGTGTNVAANPTGTDGDDLERVTIGSNNYVIRGQGHRFFNAGLATLNTSGRITLSISGIDDTEDGDVIAFRMPLVISVGSSIFATMRVNSGATGNLEYSNLEGVHLEHITSTTDDEVFWIVRRFAGAYLLQITDPMRQTPLMVNSLSNFARFVVSADGSDGADYVKIRADALYQQIRPTAQRDGSNIQRSPTAYDFRGTGVTVEDVSGVARITINAGTAPHPGTHNRYVGWSGDRTIEDADFTGLVADTDDEITIPARTTNGYVWFGIEESVGYPDSAIISGNPQNQITAFEQLSGTVPFGGDNYVIGVSHQLLSSNIAGRTITFGYN